MQITYDPTAPVIRGPLPQEDFTVIVEQTPLAIGGSSSTQTTNDVTWTTQTGAISDNNFRLLNANAAFESATPAICTVDALGQVTRLADGLADIRVTVQGLGTRKFTQQLTRTGSTTVKTGVQSLSAGSLLKYLHDQRSAILAASTPNAANQRAYMNADGSGGINPENMLLRTDVTGFTPLDLTPILFNAYRWITPKHRIFTYHTNPYWGDGSSVVQSGNSYGKKIFADTGIVYEKFANISSICKLLPSNWRSYLPTLANNLLDIPAWAHRQWVGAAASGEKYWMQAATLKSSSALVPADVSAATFAHPTNGNMGVGGDSGTPVFVGINGQAVLIGHMSWSGGGLDREYGDKIADINAALVETATAGGDADPSSYAVQTVDLSGFAAY
jgi:hypothetical protein